MKAIFASWRIHILLVIVLVFLITGIFHYSNNNIGVGVEYPEKLPDGSIVSNVVSGDQAIKMVKGLHWNPEKLVVTNAVVLEYTDGSRIWVTVSDKSNKLMENMVSKIKEYESSLPFKIVHNISISGVSALLMSDLNDPSKIHVVWVKNNLLVWAEVRMSDPNLLSETITLLIDTINQS